MRAQRSNPDFLRGDSLDCFATLAMTVLMQLYTNFCDDIRSNRRPRRCALSCLPSNTLLSSVN
ncbi:hypothetical protein FXB38_01375 [Bradyrhizobium cytisi]|uniref:Uncharacterized protein n=1 Tax=Bradyrhizobium cytisi TaxID=515489 RepID=A0A5S4X2P8_9BRAD|nr:hypothetical protein FXB38_01375 [Bradyrhizobium cytisi]